jgi:hypothetical protein
MAGISKLCNKLRQNKMFTEQSNYSNNLKSFVYKIKDSFVERIIFHENDTPTFDKQKIPFEFRYCHTITFITAIENLEITTTMTSNCIDTFWIRPSVIASNTTNFLTVNSRVTNVHFQNGYDNYAYCLKIEFRDSLLWLYSADLYENNHGGIDYKINDEMILAFCCETEAGKFENMIKDRNQVITQLPMHS